MDNPNDAPIVNGFHGTSLESANLIIGGAFELSRNPYDWLGDGTYFFQDAPERAWEWAVEHHGDNAAVVGALIVLSNCIDLLDTNWNRVITEAYDRYTNAIKETGRPIPRQGVGAHRLDREVINYTVNILAEQDINIACVRGAFIEGKPIFPNSAIFELAHVQIAIRDPELCIRQVWLERPRMLEIENGQS